ncbi:hypothetical protein R0K05_17470, partial [Planococcus sp. SIMBA_160]
EEFEQGLGAPTQSKEQQAAKDEAALEQMGVPQRTERRTTRVAERAAQRGMRRAEQEAEAESPAAQRQAEQREGQQQEKTRIGMVGPAVLAETATDPDANVTAELWQGDNGKWAVRLVDGDTGRMVSLKATPKKENAQKWYREIVERFATEAAP